MEKVHCCGVIPYYNTSPSSFLYLLVKQHNSPSWSFPKGHREKGESCLVTAKRELREETGLSVQIHENFSGSYSYNIREDNNTIVDKTVTLFLGRAHSIEVIHDPVEIQESCWFDFHQAQMCILFPNLSPS